jgi:F-type H+-transporting ATPase subunit b
MVSQIIASLGVVPGQLLTQFIIVFAMFFISKFLFFGRLQEVIEKREEQTTGLTAKSDEELKRINELNEEYKSKIEGANKEALSTLNNGKIEVTKTQDKLYRSEEEKINSYIEEQIKEVEKDIDVQKNDILKQADDLSNQLIEKIIS